jgi:hypothetical protein
MNDLSPTLAEVRTIKGKHEGTLLKKRNVVGIGIGFKEIGGHRTDQLSLVVMVEKKVPAKQLEPRDRISPHIDGIPTDVKAVGVIKALG